MSVCQGVPVSMDGSVTCSEFSTVSRIQQETETEKCEREREKDRDDRERERQRGREGRKRETTEVIRAGIVRTARNVHTARTCSGSDRIE